MIYILTCHWGDDFWVDIQLNRFRKYLIAEYKFFASCDHLNLDHSTKFDYVLPDKDIRSHAKKLNLLAQKACELSTSTNDILIFVDSDAFPITDITNYISEKLHQYPFSAVQRIENGGDLFPHPSFCITTVGFWKEIDGDWSHDHYLPNAYGKLVSDVGANPLKILNERNIPWGKLHRSNKLNIHPLFYGIYDNKIYHHGAGSRLSSGGRGVKWALQYKAKWHEKPCFKLAKALGLGMNSKFIQTFSSTIVEMKNYKQKFALTSQRMREIISQNDDLKLIDELGGIQQGTL